MTETNISTRCPKCGVVKTLENSTKDKNRPDGRNAYCKSCAKEKSSATYLKHKEKRNAEGKIAYEANREVRIAQAVRWAKDNREKRREISKRYVKNNPEARYTTQTANRLANPGMYAAHFKMRQTRKRRALSSWANLDAIEALYIECARITKETGIKHHVDHYYPLTSDVVCGLHNEFNLRVIPAVENLSKGNSFPEQENETWQH